MSIQERITNYLGNGGLFNPELMEHDKVRDLLIDSRERIAQLEQRERELVDVVRSVHDLVAFGKCDSDVIKICRAAINKYSTPPIQGNYDTTSETGGDLLKCCECGERLYSFYELHTCKSKNPTQGEGEKV